ncbi:hypothetical protein GMMP15_1810005 [Candidatus Magnetomoraceae bacterium gMMP-15]
MNYHNQIAQNYSMYIFPFTAYKIGTNNGFAMSWTQGMNDTVGKRKHQKKPERFSIRIFMYIPAKAGQKSSQLFLPQSYL